MQDRDDERSKQKPATASDLLKHRRGDATPETSRRVEADLADESSPLRRSLRDVQHMVDETSGYTASFPELRRKLFLNSVDEMQKDGTLTQQDVDAVRAAGEVESGSTSTLLSIVRMHSKLLQLHPQLAEQTKWVKTGQSPSRG